MGIHNHAHLCNPDVSKLEMREKDGTLYIEARDGNNYLCVSLSPEQADELCNRLAFWLQDRRSSNAASAPVEVVPECTVCMGFGRCMSQYSDAVIPCVACNGTGQAQF